MCSCFNSSAVFNVKRIVQHFWERSSFKFCCYLNEEINTVHKHMWYQSSYLTLGKKANERIPQNFELFLKSSYSSLKIFGYHLLASFGHIAMRSLHLKLNFKSNLEDKTVTVPHRHTHSLYSYTDIISCFKSNKSNILES